MKTKLENGTEEDIIVNLVSDGFKIKLSDVKPGKVYTITTDKNATYKEYAIAFAHPKERDPADITVVISSDYLADIPKVTIYINGTGKLDCYTEGRPKTDDSASCKPAPAGQPGLDPNKDEQASHAEDKEGSIMRWMRHKIKWEIDRTRGKHDRTRSKRDCPHQVSIDSTELPYAAADVEPPAVSDHAV